MAGSAIELERRSHKQITPRPALASHSSVEWTAASSAFALGDPCVMPASTFLPTSWTCGDAWATILPGQMRRRRLDIKALVLLNNQPISRPTLLCQSQD